MSRTIAIKQMVMFTNSFVERYELIKHHMSSLSVGTIKPDTEMAESFEELASNILIAFFSIPIAGVGIKMLTSKIIKKKAQIVVQNLPDNNTIREELYKFVYQFYRCFESVLTNVNVTEDNCNNMEVVKRHNKIINTLTKSIFEYFRSPKTDSDYTYVDHFFEAVLGSMNNFDLKDNIIPSLSEFGIYLTNTNKYFCCNDHGKDKMQLYRLLNDREMKTFEENNQAGFEKKLEDLFKKKFKEMIDVSNGYQYVLEDYKYDTFIEDLKQKQNGQSVSSVSYQMFNLPEQSKVYVERDTAFKEIENNLMEDDIVVVNGLKGFGKTDLAGRVAKKFMKNHHIFWFDCTTKISIEESVRQTYEKIFKSTINDDESHLDKIYGKYQNHSKLLIFDNAQCIDSIVQYFPKQWSQFNCKILVTTCSNKKEWKHEIQKVKFVDISNMNDNESIQLFKLILNNFFEHRKYKEYNCEGIESRTKSFNQELNCLFKVIPKHPLIIKQCVTIIFMQFRKESIKDGNWDDIIFKEIKELITSPDKHEELLKIPKNEDTEPDFYSATLTIVKRLENDKPVDDYAKNVQTAALDILNMLTYFALSDIPVAVFKSFCKNKYQISDEEKFIIDVTDLLMDNMFVKNIYSDVETANNKRISCKQKIQIEELVQFANIIYLKEKDVNVVESILREGIRCVVEYLQSNPLSDVIQHLTSLWEYASNYENIVKEFIANQQGYYKLNILVRNEKKANKGNTTMLHIIAQYNELEVIKRIVKIIKETDDSLLMDLLNKRNHLHRTPLECATEGGNLDVVKLFVQLNPDSIVSINETLNERPKQWSPLQIATKNGHKDIVDYLIEKDHVIGGVTKRGYTLAHLAAAKGFDLLLKMFVNAANVNQCTDFNFTPLHLACHVDNVQSVKLLIELGANCEAVTKYDKTALHFAADRGFDDIVQVLLSHSSNLSKMKDNKGFTPLQWAAFSNHSSTVDIMLKKDQSIVNEQTTEGNTALHLALKENSFDVVRILRKYKAKTDICNNFNETAVGLAQTETARAALEGSSFLKKIFSN